MRYLIAGLGNIGQRRRALLGERCVATADPFNEAADHRTVQECPPDRYDAAILAIPDETKIELISYLLEHGKHVLVEKPLPLPDEATARRLEALARSKRLALYTAYNHRFEPTLAALKEHLTAGVIGEVYHGRLFYGNGTVRHVAGTWRDRGLGVISDLGCHLLDLLAFTRLAGRAPTPQPPPSYAGEGRPNPPSPAHGGGVGVGGSSDIRLVAAQAIETVAPDRAVLASADGRFLLDVTYHAWRNSFAFELCGELGSLHCHGLRKWGGSELIVRERVFPSGRPKETRLTDEGPDLTWEHELAHFERLCATGSTDLATDWWIARTLRALEGQL